MTKVFTQDDLIRYIYGETNQDENQIIDALLKTDERFAETFRHLLEIKSDLDKISKQPSEHTIQNILEYSKAYNLQSHSV